MRIVRTLLMTLLTLLVACSDSDGGGNDAGGDGDGDMDEGAETTPVDLFDEDDGSAPSAEFLPAATGTCPDFDACDEKGDALVCVFEPEGVAPRTVRIYMTDAAQDGPSPLVMFFHGLSGQAANVENVASGLGPKVMTAITQAGGIVVSPEKEEGRATSLLNLPWISATRGGAGEGDNKDDDFLVMDEVIACLEEAVDVNARRIHSTGISAGGLQTGQMVVRRSGYLASAAAFSGGIGGAPKQQDEDNKLPVAIFWGGPMDQVSSLNFQQSSFDMRERLDLNGNFSIMCNHDMGHQVPAEVAEAAWEFIQQHPYGVDSPYADEIPDTMPDYCSLKPPPVED